MLGEFSRFGWLDRAGMVLSGGPAWSDRRISNRRPSSRNLNERPVNAAVTAVATWQQPTALPVF
jgi:hypothetical protein